MTTPNTPGGDNGWAAPTPGTPQPQQPQFGQQAPTDPQQPAAPQFGQQAPQYGQPAAGQSQWAPQPPAGQAPQQPQFGQRAPDAPQYGQPAAGQSQWAPQPPAGQAPQQPQYGQQAPQYGQHAPQGQWAPQQPGQPPLGQPGYGAPQYNGAPQGMYGQNLKPGIIPLRPLSLGEIYDGAFTSLRRDPKTMLGLIAIVVAVFTFAFGIVGYLVAPWIRSTAFGREIDQFWGSLMNDPAFTASSMGLYNFTAGSLTINMFTSIGIVISTALCTGLVTVAISQAVLNKQLPATEVFERAKKRVWALLGVSLLPSALAVVAAALFGLLGWLFITFLPTGLAALLAILLYFVYLIGMIIFAFRWLLAPAVLMLEERRVIDSLRRSWRLSKGSFWRILGISLLTTIIAGFISGVISGVLDVIAQLLFPAGMDVSFGALFSSLLVQVIANTLTVAFTVAVISLLYIDIRMRREALDVELQAAANYDQR